MLCSEGGSGAMWSVNILWIRVPQMDWLATEWAGVRVETGVRGRARC
jgi:hypothetical protein